MGKKVDRFTGTKFDTNKGKTNATGKKALDNLFSPTKKRKTK